uniref:Uncharacterized protein n=1 Tax=Parascaris univalens TaxID=6257 RepID=A0A915A6I6_PARUN
MMMERALMHRNFRYTSFLFSVPVGFLLFKIQTLYFRCFFETIEKVENKRISVLRMSKDVMTSSDVTKIHDFSLVRFVFIKKQHSEEAITSFGISEIYR